MGSEVPHWQAEELGSRPPTEDDIVAVCRRLNELSAKYVVIGGLAIIQAGYVRTTEDLDLIIDTSLENEALVYRALEILPDRAVRELKPGEVGEYNVCRVSDEIMVDLMRSACGIDFAEASQHIVMREVQGVPIPFASPLLLWRTKKPAKREKDAADLIFLRRLLESEGITPPE